MSRRLISLVVAGIAATAVALPMATSTAASVVPTNVLAASRAVVPAATTAVPTSYVWPNAKKAQSQACKDSKYAWRESYTVLKRTPGKARVRAVACFSFKKRSSQVKVLKVKVPFNKVAAGRYKSKAKIMMNLSDNTGQNVTWRATVPVNAGWYKVGLVDYVSCHPLDVCVLVIRMEVTNRKTGKVRAYTSTRGVNSTGWSYWVPA